MILPHPINAPDEDDDLWSVLRLSEAYTDKETAQVDETSLGEKVIADLATDVRRSLRYGTIISVCCVRPVLTYDLECCPERNASV